MMERRLHYQFGWLEGRLRRTRLWRQITFCWLITAGAELALLLLRSFTGWHTQAVSWLALVAGFAAAGILWRREQQRLPDFRALAAAIAREYPQVRELLSTAVEQQPESASGQFNYLQLRVIEEALRHPHAILWRKEIARKLSSARRLHLAAFTALVLCFLLGNNLHFQRAHLKLTTLIGDSIEVTPGDTQVERGSAMVVAARFGQPPPEASLVLVWASGKTQRLPLTRNLADPVFGTSLLEVSEAARYRIEYNGKQTRDFKITVFDYPALARADAALRYPSYTGLTNKTIRDTLRISAVEGTRLDYTLQLNKPVARARLIGKEQSLTLVLQTNAVAALDDFALTNSARYALELVDADGRTNKMPAEFVFQALPDRTPEVKIVFPRGDQRLSKLEEMPLQGEARDDFGLLKYGIGYSVAGQPPEFVELGQSAPANVPRQFTNQIALEKLGVDVDQLVSYFAWAEDYGPDGKARRTFSDIFFAEVRPFEQVFRADQSGASESQQRNQNQNQNGGRGGNQSPRLAERQKQIVIATWKLQQPGAVAPKENKP
jgi:hypothetical protein